MPPNGSAARQLPNWIDAFVDSTANINSPRIFRLWAAISTIGATLEQKVWLRTSRPLYPNLYIFIIAHPGVGKSRVIGEARGLYKSLPEYHLAPISVTFAALVDAMIDSKRQFIRAPEGAIIYHSIYICADEMGAFVHKFDPEMISGLSAFYDASDYQQNRRGADLKIRIPSAQVNLIIGATPQNIISFMPETAWGQGFTSRIIMVFSDERIIPDDFADHGPPRTPELLHDLKCINSLHGEFTVTQAYKDAVKQWQAMGEPPTPDHPKLTHYITRRRTHVYRLSMISSVNRSGGLILTEEDFLTAIGWLVEAETSMPDIFKAGAVNADAQAMDEIQHFVRVNDLGTGVSEQRIVHFARERIPITSILRVIEILEGSGSIRVNRIDRKTGARYFSSAPIRASYDPASSQSSGPPASTNGSTGLQ